MKQKIRTTFAGFMMSGLAALSGYNQLKAANKMPDYITHNIHPVITDLNEEKIYTKQSAYASFTISTLLALGCLSIAF